jgi:hypothetical protein
MRLEKEQHEQQVAAEKAAREAEHDQERRRIHAREAAPNAEIEAEQRRREELAADYQARRAAGG